MLSPRFQEGTSLQDEGTIELDLREDDTQDMETICNIIHLRNDRLPNTLPLNQLLPFALACDKYDLVMAVKYVALFWVLALMTGATKDNPSRWALLPATYFLRLEDFFKQASVDMIFSASNIVESSLHASLCDARLSWVHYMCRELESRRRTAVDRATTTVEALIRSEINMREEEENVCTASCTYLRLHISMVVIGLADSRLLPVSELREMPLDTILELMEDNVLRLLRDEQSKLRACGRGCLQNAFVFDGPDVNLLADKLVEEARRIRNNVKALCYYCVREGILDPVDCEH